ncbi:MAG TPA: PHP domain-containing protein, partial [Clostridia bacterium]|nr:PHP domain-containing protein [Clostridia bacterium]
MRLTNFIENGKFYKANYHAHSTRSDGQLPQEEAVNVFKEHGYNFLCLSEHNIVTKTDKYNTDDF